VIVFERTFLEGPLHGKTETVTREGIEPDIARADGIGRAHHYRLANLPDTSQEPIQLSYRYVGEFDPRSDYVAEVGEERFGEISDSQPAQK
jgi:hypothetical protein